MAKLLSVLLFFLAILFQQEKPKTPKDIFKEAAEFEEAGENKKAAALYLSISRNDTSYIEAQTKLMSVLNAGKDFDRSIDIGLGLITKSSKFRKTAYLLLANAYLDKGLPEKSIEIYDRALELFPQNYLLAYNKGIALYRLRRYHSAILCFQRSASFNPFYSQSHYMLGYISILQGQRTRALLSLYTYLAISPNNNKALVLLENLVNNALREEGRDNQTKSNSVFDEYDNLIKSKAALDNRFVLKVDFNASIVKQTELLLSKLTYKENSSDFWMNFYVPLYAEISAEELAPAFIYYLLTSTNKDEIKTWLSKHENEKSAWIKIANKNLTKYRKNAPIQIADSLINVQRWFYNNNAISALGNKINDETPTGNWIYLYENNEISAIGSYNNSGEKQGEWKYFHENGVLSRIEQYGEEAELNGKSGFYYSESGELIITVEYRNGKIDGVVDYFYECGGIKETIEYADDQMNGIAATFYTTGIKETECFIDNGEFDGAYKKYHENGTLKELTNYKTGIRNGEYKSYYSNGSPNEIGQYQNDMLEGNWVGYYQNGLLSFKGEFRAGKRVLEWLEYYESGSIKSRINYDENGDISGIAEYYSLSGNLQYTESYADGKLVGYSYFDNQANKIHEVENPESTFELKTFYSAGELKTQGTFINGILEGEFKEFHTNGKLSKKTSFLNGEQNGEYKEYYPSGKIKLESYYENGILNGNYISYYQSGAVEESGIFVNDNPEMSWSSFNQDGSIDEQTYFVGGELNGWVNKYGSPEHIQSATKYELGVPVEYKLYDSIGQVYYQNLMPNGTGIMYQVSTRGDSTEIEEYLCGDLNNYTKTLYPGGQVATSFTITNTIFHGPVTTNYPDGSKNLTGFYKNGQRDSLWTFHHSNKEVEITNNYSLGKKIGRSSMFHYNGQLARLSEYRNDDLVGARYYYDQYGNQQLIKIYDAEYGFISYVDNQTKDTIPFNRSGEFAVRTYFANGRVAAEQNFLDGYFNGKSRYYNNDGTLIEELNFKEGDFYGKHIEYYSNGEKYIERNYFYDDLNGVEKEYYQNGKIKRITPYLNDKKNGVEYYYREDGSILFTFTYWNDEFY